MEQAPAAITTETELCVHRWMLDAPISGVTNGVCRVCGAVRAFTDARDTYRRTGLPRK